MNYEDDEFMGKIIKFLVIWAVIIWIVTMFVYYDTNEETDQLNFWDLFGMFKTFTDGGKWAIILVSFIISLFIYYLFYEI